MSFWFFREKLCFFCCFECFFGEGLMLEISVGWFGFE